MLPPAHCPVEAANHLLEVPPAVIVAVRYMVSEITNFGQVCRIGFHHGHAVVSGINQVHDVLSDFGTVVPDRRTVLLPAEHFHGSDGCVHGSLSHEQGRQRAVEIFGSTAELAEHQLEGFSRRMESWRSAISAITFRGGGAMPVVEPSKASSLPVSEANVACSGASRTAISPYRSPMPRAPLVGPRHAVPAHVSGAGCRP